MAKFCTNCGSKMDSDATFCVECGTTNKGEYKTTEEERVARFNQFSLFGFVLSFFMPVLGLVFSIIGFVKSKDMEGSNRKFAIAGIIISSSILVFYFGTAFIGFILKLFNAN